MPKRGQDRPGHLVPNTAGSFSDRIDRKGSIVLGRIAEAFNLHVPPLARGTKTSTGNFLPLTGCGAFRKKKHTVTACREKAEMALGR